MNIKVKHTTLALLFKEAIVKNGDNADAAIYDISDKILNEPFENHYGSPLVNEQFSDVTCWCGDNVYIAIMFDWKIEVHSALRNPPQ